MAVLLRYTNRNGQPVVVIANDDMRLSRAEQEQWRDTMNRYLERTGARAKGSEYYIA